MLHWSILQKLSMRDGIVQALKKGKEKPNNDLQGDVI